MLAAKRRVGRYKRVAVDHRVKHGGRKLPEYYLWQSMIRRCHKPRSKDYLRYGALGVGVCDIWRESFRQFLSDVGPRPDPKMTLDRIDPYGNYEPGNVRWASAVQQARNRRRPLLMLNTPIGKLALVDYAKELGITRGAAYLRLKRGQMLEVSVCS